MRTIEESAMSSSRGNVEGIATDEGRAAATKS